MAETKLDPPVRTGLLCRGCPNFLVATAVWRQGRYGPVRCEWAHAAPEPLVRLCHSPAPPDRLKPIAVQLVMEAVERRRRIAVEVREATRRALAAALGEGGDDGR